MPNKIEILENHIKEQARKRDDCQKQLMELAGRSKTVEAMQTEFKEALDRLKVLEKGEEQQAVESNKTIKSARSIDAAIQTEFKVESYKTIIDAAIDAGETELNNLRKEQEKKAQEINEINLKIENLEQTLKPLIETQKKVAKVAREYTAGYANSIETLEAYPKASTESRKKRGIFQSNQVAKGLIANKILMTMQKADPSNVEEMKALKTLIEDNIKVNKKQTGFRLWNRGGDLNKHLNATLKMVDTTIEVLNKLDEPKKPRL